MTSRVPGPTVEMLADVERARREAANAADTLVPCPACERCGCCGDVRMVSPERAAKHRRGPA